MQSLNSLQKPKKSTRKNEIWRFQFIGCERVRRRDAQGLDVATPRRVSAARGKTTRSVGVIRLHHVSRCDWLSIRSNKNVTRCGTLLVGFLVK